MYRLGRTEEKAREWLEKFRELELKHEKFFIKELMQS